jgi:hypothetical protein
MPKMKDNNNDWLEHISQEKERTDTELLKRKKLFEKISVLETKLDIRDNQKGGRR